MVPECFPFVDASLRSECPLVTSLMASLMTSLMASLMTSLMTSLSASLDRYRGSAHVVFSVFRTLDTDGSGQIGFDELFEFVHGKRHSLDTRSQRRLPRLLEPPPGLTLDTMLWDVETLRTLLQQVIESDCMLCAQSSFDHIRAQNELI
jgi:EF-hand domain pair